MNASTTSTRHRTVATRTGIAGLAAVALLGGGVAAADPFGWRAPASLAVVDVVPADATSYVGVDLDPDISQKVEIARFAAKLPWFTKNLPLTQSSDVKKELFGLVTSRAACPGVSYDTDVKPWLGDRMAIVRRGTAQDSFAVVAASDEKAARAGMAKMAGCWKWGQMGLAYRQGYLVIARTQKQADAVVADGAKDSLGKRAEYVEDMGKVGSQGVLSFWGTKDGFAHGEGHTCPAKLGATATRGCGSEETAGPAMPEGVRKAVAVLAADAKVRSEAGTIRFTDGAPVLRAVVKEGRTLPTSTTFTQIDQLPADTAIAFGTSDGANLVKDNWPVMSKALSAAGITPAKLTKAGVSLPGDAETLLGKDLHVGIQTPTAGKLPYVVTTTASRSDVDALLKRTGLAARRPTIAAGPQSTQVIGSDAAWTHRVATDVKNRLATDPAFMAAYTSAEQAQTGLYINLDPFKDLLGMKLDASQRENLAALQSIGITQHNEDANYSVVVARLTAK